MSDKVMNDLRKFEQSKPALIVQHPLYDNFGAIISKTAAKARLGIPSHQPLILFFGFIRNYKGLDILLRAMAAYRKLREANNTLPSIKLLVAGEFYEDAATYHALIKELDISDDLVLRTDFIPDSEVQSYLSAADAVIQPYRNATQSGVTPLAYHFEKPMLVTNVGGLPALVPHERSGLVVEPNPAAVADGIARFYELGEDFFIPHLREEKKKYSWQNIVQAVLKLGNAPR